MHLTRPPAERFAVNTTVLAKIITKCIEDLRAEGKTSINPEYAKLAVLYINTMEHHGLIRGFIKNSHEECWDMIRTRNEDFFNENISKVFGDLPLDRVSLFKDLFNATNPDGSSVIPDDTKKKIWDKFDNLIKCAIKYIHSETPHEIIDNITVYTKTFLTEQEMKVKKCKDVEIKRHILAWKVPDLLAEKMSFNDETS